MRAALVPERHARAHRKGSCGDRLTEMHVLSVGFYVDRERRPPEELVRVWTSLTHVGEAAATAGVRVTVLQASHAPAVLQHEGITCHFVKPRALPDYAAS